MKRILSGKQDVYIEIAERYKEYIDKGILSGGEKLPSVREAACSLGVMRTPPFSFIQKSYHGLAVLSSKKGGLWPPQVNFSERW